MVYVESAILDVITCSKGFANFTSEFHCDGVIYNVTEELQGHPQNLLVGWVILNNF